MFLNKWFLSFFFLGLFFLSYVFFIEEAHWHGCLTILVLISVAVLMIWEVLPPDIIMLIGSGIFVLTDVISPKMFLKGFSQDVIVTLIMLFIIVKALERNEILSLFARYAFLKKEHTMQRLLLLMIPVSAASVFLNNTPLVLMLTPIVRKLSLERGFSPSKFLIPLSYAAILGGACSLIGSSCNLIVDGMLRDIHPDWGLGFFELSYIGIPIVVCGFLYMYFIGMHLLPDRIDVTTEAIKQTKKFTGEFLVGKDCVLHNMTIKEAEEKYFHHESLLQIERGEDLIDSPELEDKIFIGDRIVLSGGIEAIAKFKRIKGLSPLFDKHFTFDIASSHFAEVVLASTSPLIGKSLKKADFKRRYGASILAVCRQGEQIYENLSEVILRAGDSLMLLSGKRWEFKEMYNNDFYYIRFNEKLKVFRPVKGTSVILILAAMIIAVTMGIPMMKASFGAVIALFCINAISIREARQSIHWNHLILIGSAFGIGKALHVSGVASQISLAFISIMGNNQYTLIAAIFLVTAFLTQVITNHAAALLVFPIASQIALEAGFNSIESMKAIAVAVIIGELSAFSTPIGYHTNTIVYGPGGYKFTDYLKVGIPLNLIVFILSVFIIPYFWRF